MCFLTASALFLMAWQAGSTVGENVAKNKEAKDNTASNARQFISSIVTISILPRNGGSAS